MTDSERMLRIGKLLKIGEEVSADDTYWLFMQCTSLKASLVSTQKHLEYYTQQSHRQYEDRRDYLDYEEDDRR